MAQALTTEQANTLQAAKFEVFTGDDGLTARCGESEYPIFTNAMTLSIMQNGTVASNPTKYKGKAGFIHVTPENPMDEESNFAEKKILMLIGIVGYRFQLFEPYNKNKPNAQPICQSDLSGEVPSIYIKNPISDRCATIVKRGKSFKVATLCPRAKFSQLPDGTWSRPECQKVEIVAFLDITNPEFPTPSVMYLKGTAQMAWDNFSKSYSQQQDFCRRSGKHGSTYAVELSTNNEGTYFSPIFKFVDTGENTAKFNALSEYYMSTLFSGKKEEDEIDSKIEKKLLETENTSAPEQPDSDVKWSEDSFQKLDDVPF